MKEFEFVFKKPAAKKSQPSLGKKKGKSRR
jgi:hypothetical protein